MFSLNMKNNHIIICKNPFINLKREHLQTKKKKYFQKNRCKYLKKMD